VVLVLLRRVLITRLGALATRTSTQIADMLVDIVAETRRWVLAAMSIYFAALPLTLPKLEPYLHPAAKLVLLWQTALWATAGVTFWVKHYMAHRTATNDRASIAMISAVGVGVKVML